MAPINQKVSKAQLVTVSGDTLQNVAKTQVTTRLALFDQNGDPVILPTVSSAAGAPLTGLTTHAAGSLSASDTVLIAFEKLEARIVALEATVADHETRIAALEGA